MDFITGLLTVFVVINPTQSYEEIYLEANRYDPIASSRAFLTHLLNQYRKNKENNSCPTNFSNEQKWVAAWSQTANSTTPPAISRMRCGSNQSPIHYRLLQRWIRAIGEIRIMKNEGC